MDAKTIVVVEDNEAIARLIKEVLNDVPGYDAVTFREGTHAPQIVAAVHADLVILDIDLPGISGLEIYDRLRERPETAAILVLFMSAASRTDELTRRGFDVYLNKPFDIDDLLELVERHLVLEESPDDRADAGVERA